MSTVSLEARIRNAAQQDVILAGLLTSGSVFRWCTQDNLIQGLTAGNKPAVVTKLISNPSMNVAAGRMPTSWARVQFTIWGGQYTAGAQAAEDVGAALKAFLNTLNLSAGNNTISQPNYVANERGMNFPATDTPIYQKIIDGMIWSNDTVLP